MTTVRADVVALMLDVVDMSAYPSLVRESTGEPMTPEEVALVGSAGWDEFRAARDHFQRAADYAREKERLLDVAGEILLRYGFDDGPLDPVLARMSADEREIVERALNVEAGVA